MVLADTWQYADELEQSISHAEGAINVVCSAKKVAADAELVVKRKLEGMKNVFARAV